MVYQAFYKETPKALYDRQLSGNCGISMTESNRLSSRTPKEITLRMSRKPLISQMTMQNQ
jgi:hypothetical protein